MAQTWLLKWNSPRTGPPLHVGPGSHILGSSSDADLRVADPTVSRRHVRFTCDDDGVTIEDLGSTNGSVLDGKKLDGPTLLTSSGQLKVGAVSVVQDPAVGSIQSGAVGGVLGSVGQLMVFTENDPPVLHTLPRALAACTLQM